MKPEPDRLTAAEPEFKDINNKHYYHHVSTLLGTRLNTFDAPLPRNFIISKCISAFLHSPDKIHYQVINGDMRIFECSQMISKVR